MHSKEYTKKNKQHKITAQNYKVLPRSPAQEKQCGSIMASWLQTNADAQLSPCEVKLTAAAGSAVGQKFRAAEKFVASTIFVGSSPWLGNPWFIVVGRGRKRVKEGEKHKWARSVTSSHFQSQPLSKRCTGRDFTICNCKKIIATIVYSTE